jgi:hypothetical protein
VAFLIDALMDQCTADGNNALVLFLRVLADRTSRGDACHAQLANLADTLNNVFPATADQQSMSGKYNIHIHGGQVGVIGDNTEISEGINFGGKPEE